MEARLARAFARAFAGSKTPIPFELKLATADVLLGLRAKRRKAFGMLVILGWKRAWDGHLDISDSGQDLYAERHPDLWHAHVGKTADFDGAILIDRKGVLLHSGVMIEGLRPKAVARKVNPGRFVDLSEQFGFERKVHTRHLTAIAASHAFKGTTVYTVSEETGALHAYEAGRIIWRKSR